MSGALSFGCTLDQTCDGVLGSGNKIDGDDGRYARRSKVSTEYEQMNLTTSHQFECCSIGVGCLLVISWMTDEGGEIAIPITENTGWYTQAMVG